MAALIMPAVAVGAQSGSSGGGADNSMEKASALVEPAIVRMQIDWTAWVDTGADFGRVGPYQLSFLCTGFVVDPSGYIVTAGHCVDSSFEGIGKDMLIALIKDIVSAGILTADQASSDQFVQYAIEHWKIEGEAAGSKPEPAITVATSFAVSGKSTGQTEPARVIEVNPISKGDVTLLKIEASNLPIIQLADASTLDVGTGILSVGFPGSSDNVTDASLTPTYKDGKINSKKTREGGLIPVYEVSAAMSGGMSGGPTVTLDGKVVGINSFGPAGETQQFNFISPVSLIKETLTRNGVKNELGPDDVSFRAGLDAYYKGDYVTAVKKFDEVLAKDPTHKQAQEYKQKAADKVASMPSTTLPSSSVVNAAAAETANAANTASSSSNTGLLLGVGGLVLVVVVVGLVLLMKRGGSTPAVAAGPAPGPGGAPYGQPPAGAPYGGAPQQPYSAQPTAPYTPPASAAPTQPMPPYNEAPAPMGAAYPPATPTTPAAGAPATGACSQCGFVPDPSQRFCPSCGNDLHRA